MPTQLDENWDSSTWIQRYGYMSKQVNLYLDTGIYVKEGIHWTIPEIPQFKRWMFKHATTVTRSFTVYRGTPKGTELPYFTANPTKSFISTSKSLDIAKEFAWPRQTGFIHVLTIKPGVQIVKTSDFSDTVRDKALQKALDREQEIILLPGSKFQLDKKYGKKMYWTVRKE